VTFLTPPASNKKLIDFYKLVRPGGPGWRRIRAQIPGTEKDYVSLGNLKGFIVAVIAVYSALIGVGKVILGQTLIGLLLLCITLVMGYLIYRVFTGTKDIGPAPLG
jgi:hypothetical protein